MNSRHYIQTRVSSCLSTPINVLRLLATMLGASMLLFVGPFVMIWGVAASLESAMPDAPPIILLKVLSFIILLSSGYFLVGLYGHRVIHSPMLRATAVLLLCIPIGFATIPFYGHRLELPFLLAVLTLSILLLSAFVWPVWLKKPGQSQRPKFSVRHRHPIAIHYPLPYLLTCPSLHSTLAKV